MVNVMEGYEATLRVITRREYKSQTHIQREQTSLAELSGLEGTIELAQKQGPVVFACDGTPMIPTENGLECAASVVYRNCP